MTRLAIKTSIQKTSYHNIIKRRTNTDITRTIHVPFIAIRSLHFPHIHGGEEAKEKGHNVLVQIIANIVSKYNDKILDGEYFVSDDEDYYRLLKELARELKNKGFKADIIYYKIYNIKDYALLVQEKKSTKYLNAYIIDISPHDDPEQILHLFNVYTNNPYLITKIPKYYSEFKKLLEYTSDDPLTQGWAEVVFYPLSKTIRIIHIKTKEE